MRRKIIKQGMGGNTIFLPIDWVRDNNLKVGEDIELYEEDNKLILTPPNTKRPIKQIKIKLETADYNIIRSYMGGLYRAGYDEISVELKENKIIQTLQQVIDSLEGFEIFNITKDSCTIKSILSINEINLKSHFLKMIYTITAMQETIQNKKNSKQEMFELRNKILKQRDFICRSITQLRLLEMKDFPYYELSYNLWNIARNYYNIYEASTKKPISDKNKEILEKTNKFFQEFYNRLQTHSHSDKHIQYKTLMNECIKLMENKNEASMIAVYCVNILMTIQSSNSQILILNLSSQS